jgi:hypothetical protein
MTTDLAVVEADSVTVLAIEPVTTNAAAIERYRGLQEFVRTVLVKGEDYGTIPGTNKPTLYKPGAEKLSEMYGLAITLPADRMHRVERWEEGFWHYEVTCVVVSRRTGAAIAEGVGSCNSMEEKYRWRFEWNWHTEKPDGDGWEQVWNKKQRRNVWRKKVQNEARWDLPNTILKMAKKRAVIDAILSTTRSSGIFTQDVEDMPRELLQRDPDDFLDGDYREAGPAPANTTQVPPVKPLEQGEITRLEDALRAASTPAEGRTAREAVVSVWSRIPPEQHQRINATIRAMRERIEFLEKNRKPDDVDDGEPPDDEPADQEPGGRPGIDPALPGMEPAADRSSEPF